MGAPACHITAIASDAISGMYRFTIPIRAIIDRGAATGNVYVGSAQALEVTPGSPLLLQRHMMLPPHIIALAKQHGCRLVHDFDDLLWAIPADNPNSANFTPELQAAMDVQLAAADAVTASTEPLAEALRLRGCHSVTVLPNALDRRDWTVQPKRAERAKPRIGWYGQRAVHIGDLALIDGLVRALVDEADFIFFGDVPSALADVAARVQTIAPVPLPFFAPMLAALDLDLMLAPLASNAFNECKSNLRLLQAGMLAYPVVGSNVEPHRTLPITRVANSPAAWLAAVRERIAQPAALRREGETLRAAVYAGYLIDDWADRYLETWQLAAAPTPVLA
jgi:hypothetical protein